MVSRDMMPVIFPEHDGREQLLGSQEIVEMTMSSPISDPGAIDCVQLSLIQIELLGSLQRA